MALGVNRLITMSGCPAGPRRHPRRLSCWATSSDAENLFAWQMENEVGPFWQNVSQRLAARSPDLMICPELHPGVTIFTAAGFEALTRYVGRNIGINMDPSHSFGGRCDPPTVIERLGSRIGYAHGKDTLVYPDRVRRDGLLHFAPPAADPIARPGTSRPWARA